MSAVEASLARIEPMLVRMDERMAGIATKADLVKVEGIANTVDAKVSALEARVGRVETSVATVLTAAIGKAIGPVQLVAILASAVGLFGAAVTAYRWLRHQPWFVG